jgi:flagellar basal body-associated protein FliL
MSEPEAPKPEEADKGKAPSSGNKLLLIIALGNFLGVFALGGYLAYDKLIASKHAAAQAGDAKKEGEHGAKKEGGHGAEAEEKAEEGHGEEKAEEGGGHGQEEKAEGHGKPGAHGEVAVDESVSPPDSPGPIMALEPIVTNLADQDSDRYLKVTLQLRVASEGAKSEVETALVPIRSAILMYLSSLTVADISGSDKRKIVQNSLRRIANEAMPASRIKFVYFTEFVVQ